jgi:hypothetical protein
LSAFTLQKLGKRGGKGGIHVELISRKLAHFNPWKTAWTPCAWEVGTVRDEGDVWMPTDSRLPAANFGFLRQMPSVPTGRLLRLIRPSPLSRTFSTSKCRLEQIHGADEAVCRGRTSALCAALILMLVHRPLAGCQLPREQMNGWHLSTFMPSASLAVMMRSYK